MRRVNWDMRLKKSLHAISAIVLLSTVAALSAFANSECSGGSCGGGGSSVAAEIQRATDEFISAVRTNPKMFPGIDAEVLARLDPEILVTAASISHCNSDAKLDAVSDFRKNQSKFNASSWLSKSWLEKVHLAGHERLVLAGYERSNRYTESNKIFSVDLQNREKQFGAAKDLCDFGVKSCQFKKTFTDALSRLLSGVNSGEVRANVADYMLDGERDVAQMQVLLLVGLKKIEIQRRWINLKDPAVEVEEYRHEVQLAYDHYTRPLLQEVNNLIKEKSYEETECVQRNPASSVINQRGVKKVQPSVDREHLDLKIIHSAE